MSYENVSNRPVCHLFASVEEIVGPLFWGECARAIFQPFSSSSFS